MENTGWLGFLCVGGLALIFGAVGIGVLILYRRGKQKAQESSAWPSVTGKVLEAEVSSHTETDSEGESVEAYAPRVVYEYVVNGVAYRGNRLAIGPVATSRSRHSAEQEVARYPLGGEVQVFYNPQNPAEAVLQTRLQAGKVMLILGIIFLGLGVLIACGGGLALIVSLLAQ